MNYRKRRNELDLTMKQVATQADISESTYCLIENGKRNPSLSVAMKLASVLKCTIDELVNGDKTATAYSERRQQQGPDYK